MKPRYSGDKSVKFWHRVNRLPEPRRSEAYSLGVALQNLEGQVLRTLLNLEQKERDE